MGYAGCVGLLAKLVVLVRFFAAPLAGLLLGAAIGLGLGLAFDVNVLANGGFGHAGHAGGGIVLVLLAFPPVIAGLVGANVGYLGALLVETVVIVARGKSVAAPRRIAKLAMFGTGVAVLAWLWHAARSAGGDAGSRFLAAFVLAAVGLVPVSLLASALAALTTQAVGKARHAARPNAQR